MTRSQTAQVLAAIQCYDHRQVGESDVAAWHAVIGEYEFADCMAAVTAHFRESDKWMMPAHVVGYVKAQRRRAAELDHEQRTRVMIESATPADRVLVHELAGRARSVFGMPAAWQQRRAEALHEPCPWCRARPGEPCVSLASGAPLRTGSRVHDARKPMIAAEGKSSR